MNIKTYFLIITTLSALVSGCDNADQVSGNEGSGQQENTDQAVSGVEDKIPALAYIEHNERYNAEAVIPPQCYTKTDGKKNPCYVCHQASTDSEHPNMMKDIYLQGVYDFSEVGVENHWKNLFVDRRELIKEISDDEISKWVNQDNYSNLIARLENDSDWKGEIPKIENLAYPDKAFDSEGFARDGSQWVAFKYKPMPGMFWPTNGSTDDVMIRMPEAFRTLNGQYSKEVYKANLAILEMAIKGADTLTPVDLNEIAVGSDLNGDGQISDSISAIVNQTKYVGDASETEVQYMLYPKGVQFLHTVRYVGVDGQGNVYNSPRIKEVRYMVKKSQTSIKKLQNDYFNEAKEKHLGSLPKTIHLGDRGISNGFGWILNAYIEDQDGELRQQHEQELEFCNGCHKTIGSTIDQTFAFARKMNGEPGWGYINLKEIRDVPSRNESQGEYLTYFERVGGGDEFRRNAEMLNKWFKEDGTVDRDKVTAATSIYDLVAPTPERASVLNKAYKTIVSEQSYIYGRDPVVSPDVNVLEHIPDDIEPLEADFRYMWDIRLNWDNSLLSSNP